MNTSPNGSRVPLGEPGPDTLTVPTGAPAAPRSAPQIGAWGFDTAGMDRSIVPGADFYRHVDGHRLATTQIPADKLAYGILDQLADLSDERTRQIVDAAQENHARSQGCDPSRERRLISLAAGA